MPKATFEVRDSLAKFMDAVCDEYGYLSRGELAKFLVIELRHKLEQQRNAVFDASTGSFKEVTTPVQEFIS